jgi:CRISPR-associated protein Csy2
MVDNVTLESLLVIKEVEERNIALRRAFAPYTGDIDVTGNEADALMILLNLTYPKKLVKSLLDKRLAKKTLRNEQHIDFCIAEVAWLHTHNLKYPDIRVSKQRLIAPAPVFHPQVLSSANFTPILGWSHDSAKVNLAKLFGSHFIWQGNVCCLATLLLDPPSVWKEAFQALGMLVKDFLNICGRVKGFLPEAEAPSLVDRFSNQVRMPYRNGYLAVTPVVSHVLQSEIQKATMAKQAKFTHVEFTRPASVGDLSASLGGNVRVLNYPPKTKYSEFGLSDSMLGKVQNGQSALNHSVFHQSKFVQALEGLLSLPFALALKQRRQQKVISYRQVRSTLSEWLAPLLEWRLEVKDNPVQLSKLETINGTFEYSFVTMGDEQLTHLLAPLFSQLNSVLSHSNLVGKYAFHQQLMTPLKSSLKWLLDNLSNESTVLSASSDDESQQRYLYLKGIRVFDAQALSNPYCSGVPSLTAVWGMMHHYQRCLNELLGSQLRMTSFSWFIRHYSAGESKNLPEYGMHGPKENQFRRAGIIDNKYCDLVFDLVIHIDGYEEDLNTLDSSSDILRACFPARFAGGVMHPPELDSVNDWCELYDSEALLYSKLRRLPASGKWIMPIRYSIANLSDLLILLKQNRLLHPVMYGYLLLGTPQKRTNAYEPLHCYAESAIGLVECANAIDIRLQGMQNYFRRAFWMLDIKEHSMLMKRI